MMKLRALLGTYTKGINNPKFIEPLAATMLSDLLTSLGVSSSNLQELFNQLLGSSDPSDVRMRPVINLLLDELSVQGQPRPTKATVMPPKQKRDEKMISVKPSTRSPEGLPAYRPNGTQESVEMPHGTYQASSLGSLLAAMGFTQANFNKLLQQAFGGMGMGVTDNRLSNMITILRRGLSSPGQPPPSDNQITELLQDLFSALKASKSESDPRIRTVINLLKRGLSASKKKKR